MRHAPLGLKIDDFVYFLTFYAHFVQLHHKDNLREKNIVIYFYFSKEYLIGNSVVRVR